MKACVLMDVVGCIDVVLEGNGQKEGEGGRSESHKEGGEEEGVTDALYYCLLLEMSFIDESI